MATSRDLLASLSTLHLFSKIRPDLMIPHAETLQPYLEVKASVSLYSCLFSFALNLHEFHFLLCMSVELFMHLEYCVI